MKKMAVIAFGGNALLRSGQKGTYNEQLDNVKDTCKSIVHLIRQGYNIIIGHGNGPQVGNVMLQHEITSRVTDVLAMPLDFCVSETQGSIGYLIEQGLRNILFEHSIKRNVVGIITQVVVDRNDPLFINPTKPVGPYYKEKQVAAFLEENPDSPFREDPKGNGWRRVVASPEPHTVLNIDIVKTLAEAGNIVITVGGGGIPIIIDEHNQLRGVEAVIDKDLASALVAIETGADEFYILTDVPKVYINFRKSNEISLDVITIEEAERYLEDGHFAEGSMAPKIRAALYFVKHSGKECIITEAKHLTNPECGTRIVVNRK
ncbi:MAG: carbamate kinase [Bacteroidales bacterium]|jgi:carbamate kinase|nr:carbamate kinase [Bacteroidales bacterium]